ncbi:MAG: hypothetical protein MJ154_01865 [Candidatus Saccharibacteria bacterium]|nr:hypothetical protein [Candidatus Saccharibacteria bacterium]
MKKILSMLMLLVVLALAMPTTVAYACDCGCCKKEDTKKDTSKKKTNQFDSKTKALLKPVKSYAKKYGWTVDTSVSKKEKTKRYTKVHFANKTTHVYMDVTIRAVKKSGNVAATWWFKDKNDGKWYQTSSDGIKSVLKNSGKKAA